MSAASDIGRALEDLVHQFSDPWSFLRELIQNAIDAGSPEIHVHVEHQPPASESDGGPGLMLVEIADAGEGMDRQIIDTRLTRLFSSAKDGDYTKIGRFGIGFVSVFAIEPDLVVVDTGRTGEYWRVLFKADRSFERIALDHPVEGTTIQIYKQAEPDAVEAARASAARVLEYWCKHATAEILLDGERISGPMALDAECVLEHEEEGTRVLVGLVDSSVALRGYYHGGLTLHEEIDDRLPNVAFKIDSRYLEHTLTRDNVIRDENYDKAMAIVARLAATELPAKVFEQLEAILAGDGDPRLLTFLTRRATTYVDLASRGELKLERAWTRRAVIPRVHGPPCSLDECRKRARKGLWLAAAPSPVTAALHEAGELVLANGGALENLLTLHTERPPKPVSALVTATAATEIESRRWQPLRAAALQLLDKLGARVTDLHLGHLAYPESRVAHWVAISQGEFGELTPIEDATVLNTGWLSSKRALVLNADHDTVALLLELAETEPEFAAYLLLKLFHLRAIEGHALHETDTILATAAAEARWRR